VRDGRKRTAVVIATLVIAALSGSVLVATPTYAKPTIKSVQARVSTLFHQAEVASERYNKSRMALGKAKERLGAVQADLKRERHTVGSMHRQVAEAIIAQSQGQAFSTAQQVLVSNQPDKFLDQLVMASQFNDQKMQLMQSYATQAKQLQMREASAKRELVQIAATKRSLQADKKRIDAKAASAKDLLSHLKTKAAQRRAAQAAATSEPSRSASTPAPTAPVAASGKAAIAVRYAMAQIGKSYVYGAAGPDSFDCSGLTMMAWQQAGVSLPHSAASQMSYGTPVSSSQLQPGDLVFYYSPVSHVGMYIGNGKIVNAENPSVGVTTAPLFMMPYSGAVRPG
jgi:cell wall-associated NlpC family hydrolase